jgi:hypothetical protein
MFFTNVERKNRIRKKGFGGVIIKKKIVFIVLGIIICILLVFGYHHFLKFQTYSVSSILEVENEYSYDVSEIVLFPFQIKDKYTSLEEVPWYFKVNWLPYGWRNNIAKIHRFFSFPYKKNSSEIALKGVLSGKQPDIEEIIVKINNNEYKPKEFHMTNFQDDSMTFIIMVKTDDSLKSIQSLSLQMENTNLNWDDLEKSKDNQYILSPFYNHREYLKK